MSSLSSAAFVTTTTTTKVFDIGNYQTAEPIRVLEEKSSWFGSNKPSDLLPPKPLLIFTPLEAGEFPVLLLLHGFLYDNSFYSQLSNHIASHGFIVVLPQFHSFSPDATEDIKSTAAITSWLPGSKGLQNFLPLGVRPNLNKLGLAGHSRGGKAAFALTLNKVDDIKLDLKISALIGIDPVDGSEYGKQTTPPVLTYVPHSFGLEIPVMVIGSGLGEVKNNVFFPACAPIGVNHKDFFNECCDPAFYFVAKDYGHNDVLDDETNGLVGWGSYCLCKNGKSREPMRRFVGGVVVAFANAYLKENLSDLMAVVNEPEISPVVLEPPMFPENLRIMK